MNPLADRLAVLAAIQSVDAVTWFGEDTPLALIEACAPDVLVKGGDWPVERIVGAGEVIMPGCTLDEAMESGRWTGAGEDSEGAPASFPECPML